jgi:WD40 repeat protein
VQKQVIEGGTIDIVCYLETTSQLALTGMSTNTVSIYNIDGWKHVKTLPGDHTKTITGIIELPQAKQLITCAMDRSIIIFDIKRVHA